MPSSDQDSAKGDDNDAIEHVSILRLLARIVWFGSLWLFCLFVPAVGFGCLGPFGAAVLALGCCFLWFSWGYVSEGAFLGNHLSEILGMPMAWAPLIYLGIGVQSYWESRWRGRL